MTKGEERRVHPRINHKMLVQLRFAGMDEFVSKYAFNMSTGGIFIHTKNASEKDSMVYLQFKLEDGQKLIEGLGKVVHINPPEHATPGMGIEFVNLDTESLELIDKIIEERQKGIKAGK